MKCNNILITGGAGFIGSNFIKYYLNKYNNIKIINLDSLTYAGNLNNLTEVYEHKNYKFIHGSICDIKLIENIFLQYQIDGVINFAAETHVDNSVNNPDVFIQTNVNGVFNLLTTAYKFWMHKPFIFREGFEFARFHQVSTDEVYGSANIGSFNELSNYNPNSPYSASKASADLLVRSFVNTYGLNSTVSISSNNYGINQNEEKLIPLVIEKCILRQPIKIYGDGENIRDWLHVNDHCNAIDLIFNNGKKGAKFNIGADNEISNNLLAKKICMTFDLLIPVLDFSYSSLIEYVEDRPGHDFRYSISSEKVKKDLGWKVNSFFDKDLKNLILHEIKYKYKLNN